MLTRVYLGNSHDERVDGCVYPWPIFEFPAMAHIRVPVCSNHVYIQNVCGVILGLRKLMQTESTSNIRNIIFT